MLAAAATTVLVLCATLLAATPLVLAERTQRRRSDAMRKIGESPSRGS